VRELFYLAVESVFNGFDATIEIFLLTLATASLENGA